MNCWQRPVWRCDQEKPLEASDCKDNELYSMRNSAINRGEFDDYFKSIVAEINKRGAVHPLLIEATKEQVDELQDRTIKNAVKAKLKNTLEPNNYKHLLNDIQLWRNKYENIQNQP